MQAKKKAWRILRAFVIAGAALAQTSQAQMVTGTRMPGYAETFGVKLDQRSYPYSVQLYENSVPGSVLWPGDQPTLSFQIGNNGDAPLAVKGRVDIIAYGTKGRPGDIWVPDMFKIADAGSVPIEVNIAPKGFQNITIKPTVPERFGAYAFVVDLGQHGRQFIGTVVRTFAAHPERVQFPKLGMDVDDPDALYRLNCKSIRRGVGYKPTTDKDFAQWFAKQGEALKEYHSKNVAIILEFGVGGGTQPLRRWRPHLTDDGIMRDTKSDGTWAPENDADFKKLTKMFVANYGWPKGPITAVKFMNEPWEGLSISGWGADMPRYREIYMALAQGTEEARREAGVKVLLGGADSSSNSFDKFFGDGSDDYLKWFDFLSIHYQGMAPHSTVKQWVNRKHPNGRVKIWDTESWVANTDDRVAAVLATNMSTGHDRAVGIYGGNIYSESDGRIRDENGREKIVRVGQAWSVAAAVGAAQHFMGERNFREMLFKNGLPWVMVFDGLKNNSEDGTIVVTGDIGDEFGHDILLFRTARGLAEVRRKAELKKQLAALPPDAPQKQRQELITAINKPQTLTDASITINDMGGRVRAFDFYGNAVPSQNGRIIIPLDHRGFYLRGDGRRGSFAQTLRAVREGYIQGLEPLATVCHDMTAPIGKGGQLKLSLTNILNRPVAGMLQVQMGKLKLTPPMQMLQFKAHETKVVNLSVTGAPEASNSYLLALRFDAGKDGYAVHEEEMRVNFVSRRTPKIDGNLDDWKGVLPQTIVTNEAAAPTLTEAAWLPFEKFDTSLKKGFGTGYLAYDKDFFYFAAKIADSTDDGGTLRFATRDDNQFFYPEISYQLKSETVLQKRDAIQSENPDEVRALQKPDGNGRIMAGWESTAKSYAVDVNLPKAQQVALYFQDWDTHVSATENGRRNVKVTITDRDSGKQLDSRDIKNFRLGKYQVYDLSGNVRIKITTNSWISAVLNGIFFDNTAENITGNAARFVKIDEATQGNWKGVYGANGYVVVGAGQKLPEGVALDVPEFLEKTALKWPEGVRRYSYREYPILPAGSSPDFDNVQIAFNALPQSQKPWYSHPKGTMPGYTTYYDTDYEYALNQVAEKNGGGTEIWRLRYPGMPHKHFYPRQGKSPFDGPARGGNLVVTRDATTRYVECAIPWSEIPGVKQKLDRGEPMKFSFRINDNAGVGTMELSKNRSVAKRNGSFMPDWKEHWANELEFGWEK